MTKISKVSTKRKLVSTKQKAGRLNDKSSNSKKKQDGVAKSKSFKKKFHKPEESSDESEFEVAEDTGSSFVPSTFPENSEDVEETTEELSTRKLVQERNKALKTGKANKSGGFQKMGLSFPVLKGALNKGYKVPTPIQRKTIPLIMDGKDVVAMARTGSGKTAAFLIPMFERLQVHSTQGVRAVILSPTRELALQTMKFAKDLGKYTDLKFTLILGGDSMEGQFAALHQHPDVIIATPGRFLHLLVEMEMKRLDVVEYIVFDEADRLFEMGFQEQLKEIIGRLPESRQTLLFSATLPKVLVDFAMAGLTDPTLIRLDVDTKISDKLQMKFFFVRPEDKLACLLYTLQEIIPKGEQTVVFVATKHHVDFLQELLTQAGISSTYIYSSLDQTARKINIAKFRKKLSLVLIVTDIAARGIDIPMLDNVINFDFPSKPKIFVHRVGRVARAGRSGTAYSFVMKDELAFTMDLHLFLGRPLKLANDTMLSDVDDVMGSFPQSVLAEQQDFVRNASSTNFNLVSMQKVMMNGYKQYVKSREVASTESIKRSKELDLSSIINHPIFKDKPASGNKTLNKLLTDLQKFKPSLTVFEAMNTKKSRESESVMKTKRAHHSDVIERQKQRLKDVSVPTVSERKVASVSDDKYIADCFQTTIGYKNENYIPRQSSDHHGEQGFNVKTFRNEASDLAVDMTADDSTRMRQSNATKKWDRKRKKFVSTNGNQAKKIKTESGSYISASYKSKRYEEWKKRTHYNTTRSADSDGETVANTGEMFKRRGKGQQQRRGGGGGSSLKGNKKQLKGTLKTKDQIIKNRIKAQRDKSWQAKKGGAKSGGTKSGGAKSGGARRGGKRR